MEHNLKINDVVDAKDKHGNWFEAVVLKIERSKVKVHYKGWKSKWDSFVPIDSENILPLHTKTLRWRENIKVNDLLEIRGENEGWYRGQVIKKSNIFQSVLVETLWCECVHFSRWAEIKGDDICLPCTHKKGFFEITHEVIPSASKAPAQNIDTFVPPNNAEDFSTQLNLERYFKLFTEQLGIINVDDFVNASTDTWNEIKTHLDGVSFERLVSFLFKHGIIFSDSKVSASPNSISAVKKDSSVESYAELQSLLWQAMEEEEQAEKLLAEKRNNLHKQVICISDELKQTKTCIDGLSGQLEEEKKQVQILKEQVKKIEERSMYAEEKCSQLETQLSLWKEKASQEAERAVNAEESALVAKEMHRQAEEALQKTELDSNNILVALPKLMHKHTFRNMPEETLCKLEKLFGEYQNLVKQCILDEKSSKINCCVCLERSKSVLLKPCNHLCVCSHCAEPLNNCPICRETVTAKETVFI